MSAKNAKALRKALGLNKKSKREYKTFLMCNKVKKIYQFDGEGGVNLVERDVPRYITECVSGDRKVYQEAKKLFNKKSSDLVSMDNYSELPSDEAIKSLNEEIIAKEKENE